MKHEGTADGKNQSRILDYMHVNQVAAELGVSQSFVYKLINGKVKGVPRLPSLKLGRCLLVSQDTLKRWARQCEQEASGADGEVRHASQVATRKCRYVTEEVLDGSLEGSRASPEPGIRGKIPNYKN